MSYDINAYWNSLAYSAGNLKNPIYKWSCFSNATISELGGYIQDITEQLNSYDISNAIYQYDDDRDTYYKTEPPFESKIFATLFLVRCALINRCSDDWDLAIRPEYTSEIGLDDLSPSQWASFINTAERVLGRPPLTQDSKAFHHCARILVESGIPLKALQNPKSKVVEGLRSIWTFRTSAPNISAYNKAKNDFESTGVLMKRTGIFSQVLPLPGGRNGCRAFFDIGLNLLESAIAKQKNASSNLDGVALFKELGFENPSQQAIDYIFNLKQQLNIPQPASDTIDKKNTSLPRIQRKVSFTWKGKTP
ncbi:MAG: hypothetical protein SPL21_05630 [Fibrobacter sp.]|nr:hypothetical protein [Fibrobacter sp.]